MSHKKNDVVELIRMVQTNKKIGEKITYVLMSDGRAWEKRSIKTDEIRDKGNWVLVNQFSVTEFIGTQFTDIFSRGGWKIKKNKSKK